MRLCGASLPMLIATVLGGPASGEEPPASTAEVSGATIDRRLEAPLPEEVRSAVPDPVQLPDDGRTEVYRTAFTGVWTHLESLPPDALFADAARLGRIRQRQTAGERKAEGQRFSTFVDLHEEPEAYRGRPLTVWGSVRSVRRLPERAEPGADGEAFVEAAVAPLEHPSRRVLVILEGASEVLPSGESLDIPVTVTGFVFRGSSADAGEEWTPLLVASRITRHVAAHPPLPLEPVEHRSPVLPDEADSFYRFLKHARLVDYQEQIEAAREFRRERVEQLPADSQADYRHRLQEAMRLRREQPQEQAAYQKAVSDARRIRQFEQNLPKRLADQPSEFPLVAALFWSIDSADPERWRGRPVTLSGNMRKLVSYAADRENPYQVGTLYEAWLFSDDTRSLPSVVVASDIPAGIPRGEDLNERVSVTGYFFKIYAYKALNGRVRYAPLILAQKIDWHPRSGEDEFGIPRFVWVLAGVVVAGLVVVVWRTSRSDRRAARRLLSDDSPPRFDV